MRRLFEWFWGLLPDRCQMPSCSRKGVRGNENRIAKLIICDDCFAKWFHRGMKF